ncbi:hypothetical protein SAMN05444156_1479 [Verrucomicrobium sp. GAS474]|uniref:hypothetical protein n=1 Tax=Verrucomicrobium sp. GAS474 TaxID=1882831 RepID=UPI00087C42CA|nr:hypothetical protein [Verrucomicrobium sp. GAS474]SDU01960.1 hypothetical protein SAMN05444156_1479 [Verrucomicrobium sp. GAS474]
MKSRVESQFLVLIAVSVLIHLGVLLLFVSGALDHLMPLIRPTGTPPPPPPRITVLKLQDPPKPPAHPRMPDFIPTLPSQEAAQADPNAVLESERNTLLRSRETAQKESSLPSMSGDTKSGLVWQNTPSSPAVNSTPSQYSPQKTQQTPQKSSPTDPSPAETSATNPTKDPAKDPTKTTAAQPAPIGDPSKKDPSALPKQDSPVLGANGVPLFPAPADPAGAKDGKKDAKPNPKPSPDKPEEKTQQPAPQQTLQQPQQQQNQQAQQQQNPSPAAPPPSSPSFAQARTQIAGGAPKEIGDPSPDSKETEIGRYKAKLYKTIGTYWYINVEKNMTILGVGEVRFKFYVRANGMIDQITAISSSGQADVLKGVSLKAIREGLPFEPFSDSMKQQLGDGYWEEITFSIY